MWALKPSPQVKMPRFSFAQQQRELVTYQNIILNVWLMPCAGTEISLTRSKDCSIQCSFLFHHNGAVKEVSCIQYSIHHIVKIMNSEYSRLEYGGRGGGETSPLSAGNIHSQKLLCSHHLKKTAQYKTAFMWQATQVIATMQQLWGWVAIIYSPVFHNSLS